MEAIGLIMLGIFIVSGLAYAIAAHSVSVVARKTGHGNTMEILAWIPILQVIPVLAVGGSSLLRCLVGTLALVVANAVLYFSAQFLGDGLGGVLFACGLVFSVVLCSVYLARISWNTAAARNLPGWFGLLVGVPGISFFVYPIMAFHDGWAGPHKLGPVIALLVAAVSIGVQYPLLSGLLESQEGISTHLAEWTETEPFADLGRLDPMQTSFVEHPESMSGVAPAPMPMPMPMPTEVGEDHAKSIRALFDLKGRFDTLDALTAPENMLVQDHRIRALGLVQSIRSQLEVRRTDLDDKTYEDLANHLVLVEARIHGPASQPGRSGTIRIADARRTVPIRGGSTSPAAPAPFEVADAPPVRPFVVNVSDSCPIGTELQSRTGDKGEEEWCQQLEQYGGLRHGWYARYFEGGQPEQVGEYRNGLRVGVWSRFYGSGEVRAQAEFEEGLQHGWLLSFDENGERRKAVRFEQGAAVR